MKRATQVLSDSDSDLEVWDYKALKREKKGDGSLSQRSQRNTNISASGRSLSQRKNKRKTTTTSKSTKSNEKQNKRTRKTAVNVANSHNQENGARCSIYFPSGTACGEKNGRKSNELDGRCPACQVPFSILGDISQTSHVNKCLERTNPEKECPHDLQCESRTPDHYWKFNHSLLADEQSSKGRKIETYSRSNLKLGEKEEPTVISSDSEFEEEIRATCSSQKQKALSLKKTRNSIKDTKSNHSIGKNNVKTEAKIGSMDSVTVFESGDEDKDLEQMIEDAFNVYTSPRKNKHVSESDDDCKSISDVDNLESDSEVDDVMSPKDTISKRQTPAGGNKIKRPLKQNSKKDLEEVIIDLEDTPEKKITLSQGSLDSFIKCASPISPIVSLTPNKNETTKCMKRSSLSSSQKLKRTVPKNVPSTGRNKPRTSSQMKADMEVAGNSRDTTPVKKMMLEEDLVTMGDERRIDTAETSKTSKKKRSSNDTTIRESKIVAEDDLMVLFSASESDNDLLDDNADDYELAIDTGGGFLLKEDSKEKRTETQNSNASDQIHDNDDENEVLDTGGGFLLKKEDLKEKRTETQNLKASEQTNDNADVSKTKSKVNAFTLLMNRQNKPNGSNDSGQSKVNATASSVKSTAANAMDILMKAGNKQINKQVKVKSITGSEELPKIPPSDMGREATERGYYGNRGKRPCPFYKKMPDTPFTVDAFNFGIVPGCKAYFLSHFHYDHYMGLSKKFQQPIYCSKITGNLVQSKIGVDKKYINTLKMEHPTVIEGVEVTLLEANHCPGAVLFLFRLKSGKVYLHTGDFRAHHSMESYPPLLSVHVNQLYLDTTYCDPSYVFPPQKEVIDFTVSLVQKKLRHNPDTLIICGCYTIGKERIFTGIADALQCRICVLRDKKKVLDCLEDDRLKKIVSLTMEDSNLHVLPMGKLNLKSLHEHKASLRRKFTNVLAFEPTGWTHSNKITSLDQIRPKVDKEGIQIYGVPYSEHSSYLEMKRFVQFLKPDKILPTVNNGNARARQTMEGFFKSWMDEVKDKPTIIQKKQPPINSWCSK